MNDQLEKFRQALSDEFPDLVKVSFRNRDGKYYVNVVTNVLDYNKGGVPISAALNRVGSEFEWSTSITSSNIQNDQRDITFRLNYERKF